MESFSHFSIVFLFGGGEGMENFTIAFLFYLLKSQCYAMVNFTVAAVVGFLLNHTIISVQYSHTP